MTAEVTLLGPADAGDEALVAELVRVINAAYALGEAGLWREGATRTAPATPCEFLIFRKPLAEGGTGR